MIIRDIKLEDLEKISKLIGKNTETIKNAYYASKDNLLVDSEGVKGFIIVKDVAGINELTYWHLKPEHALALKAMTRKLTGTIAAYELAKNKERIKILESAGLKKLKQEKGIYTDNKAIILIKQD